MSESRRITLLTDFGTADGYVAAMKGVIAALAPHAHIDDASHDIPAGDIAAAAWALGAYWRYYPARTIHIVVVDPGVGSQRRALAVAADERILLAPDNGVLSLVLREATTSTCIALDAARVLRGPVSATFHGRDIFAPAAARIANGVALDTLGAPVRAPVILDPNAEQATENGVVLHIDRFGNLITNLTAAQLINGGGTPESLEVIVAYVRFPLHRTYADVAPGETVAVIGSRGTVELSVRDGSAAVQFGIQRGDKVVLRKAGD